MTLSPKYENSYNMDVLHFKKWMPSIDCDCISKCNLYSKANEINKTFFHEIMKNNDLKTKEVFSLEFKNLIILFNLKDTSFSFKLKCHTEDNILLDKEILSKTKSNYILPPFYNNLNHELSYPFHFGYTLRELIEENKRNHILNEYDKILLSIQIITAIKDLYNENANNSKYRYRYISDRSFFIDYMKNAYLFSISDDNISSLFNNCCIEDQKKRDINTINILLEEILKEADPSDVIRPNNSYWWYNNYHTELNKILNKFKDVYDSFDQIIEDLKKTAIYEKHKIQIELRLKYAEDNYQCLVYKSGTFYESMISQWSLNLDVQTIYRQLFKKICEEKKNDPKANNFLFFNLVLHIFFPSFRINNHVIDWTKILEIFDSGKDISATISIDLLQQNLPAKNDFLDSLSILRCELKSKKNPNEEENSLIKDIDIIFKKIKDNDNGIDDNNNGLNQIIKSEFSQRNDSNKFRVFLKKVYFYYFPIDDTESLKNPDFIFDYFGMIKFLVNKANIIYISQPTISDINMKRLKTAPTDDQLNNFFRKSFLNNKSQESNKLKPISNNADGFQCANTTYKIMFNLFDSSFYLERTLNHDKPEFRKRVIYQDEIFTKIEDKKADFEKAKLDSKYIIHLNKEKNMIKTTESNTSSVFPLFTCTLNQLIQINGRRKVIQDSDKLLWSIQIAMALGTLQKIEEENDQNRNKFFFLDSIHDQFFFINAFKNIYLCTLAFNVESKSECSTSYLPLYFCSEKDSTYIYKYGVLIFEIFAEIEPKHLFGNMSRKNRLEILNAGYSKFDMFNKYKEYFSNIYGRDIGDIIDRCIDSDRKDRFTNFIDIIEELKKTDLYKRYKYIIDYRYENAQVIDSSYKYSFQSLLISAVSGMQDISQLLDNFYIKMKTHSSTEMLEKIFEDCNKVLCDGIPQKNYFESIGEIPHSEKFQGDIDSLLGKIIPRLFYNNKGKAVYLKESVINKFGLGTERYSYLDYNTKMMREGIFPTLDFNEETFSKDTVIDLSEKVPIISLDYYLQIDSFKISNDIFQCKRWIYQIIYFLHQKGFIPSTNQNCYEIQLSDFALYYNNLTDQFDIDLVPKSVNQIRYNNYPNQVNLASFIEILKKFIKSELPEYHFDIHFDFNNLYEFIYCFDKLYKKKKIKKRKEIILRDKVSLFESKIAHGFFFYDILHLYEKQLRDEMQIETPKQTKDEQLKIEKFFSQTIDRKSYLDQNYKILYSKLNRIFRELTNHVSNPILTKVDSNSGFYLFYEDDSNELCKTDILSEKIKSENVDLLFFHKIFPTKKDAISECVETEHTVEKVIQKLLTKVTESDEIECHQSKTVEERFKLIRDIFPEENVFYIYKIFQLNDQKVFNTLKCLFSYENIDYNNYNKEMDVSILCSNFPEIFEKLIESKVEAERDSISSQIQNQENDKKKFSKKVDEKIDQITIEKPKKPMIERATQKMIDELKIELRSEFELYCELNSMGASEKVQIQMLLKDDKQPQTAANTNKCADAKETATTASANNADDGMGDLAHCEEDDCDALMSDDDGYGEIKAKFKQDIFEKIEKAGRSKIAEYYDRNDRDFCQTTKSICGDLFRLASCSFSVVDYANQTKNKYSPSSDKKATRTLEIYSDLARNSYMFLVKRYIYLLNPKLNYEVVLKIQNKNAPNVRDLNWDEVERNVRRAFRDMPYKIRKERGSIIIDVSKTID